MRVVLDTNVPVSAILTPGGPAHRVVRLALRGDVTPLVDDRIASEYRQVLARGRFRFPGPEVERLLEGLFARAQEVLPVAVAGHFPDEEDRAFVEVAVGGGAEAIVTGNAPYFRAAKAWGLRVESPREFLEFLEG